MTLKKFINLITTLNMFINFIDNITLSTLVWNETNYLKVYGFSDGMYNQQDRSTYIQLSTTTVTTLNDIWKDIQIPDIKVV
jgi:hypothetical protein